MESLPSQYQEGEWVSYSFKPWIILLSFVVSLLGAETTVELLHRRWTGRGWINQYDSKRVLMRPAADRQCRLHLGLCAISFGLVAIWCMHFVGNKAIVMGDGRTAIQPSYSAMYTALSAVLPVIGLYVGFSVADRYEKTQRFFYLSLIITGIAAGLSVMGMHYLGNLGTSNYTLENNYANIFGAAAIAVLDCWLSFTIFFHLREHWINFWWRRFLCAALLAAAVSGMHWTAAVGTRYRLRTLKGGNSSGQNVNVILASILCMIALIGCMALLYWTNIRHRRQAKRAREVVLAALIRDEHGKILVTQDGLPPCRIITTEFYRSVRLSFSLYDIFANMLSRDQQSFRDHLDNSHPVFHWMYRISCNWGSIVDLVPTMREYLNSEGLIGTNSTSGPLGDTQPASDASKRGMDWPVLRAQFCVAAQELANELHMRLQDLGILHTELMTTGINTFKPHAIPISGSPKFQDVESDETTKTSGKGQTIFISRNVDLREAEELVALGFRFAALANVSGKPTPVLDIMATKMQVEKLDLSATLRATRPISAITIPKEMSPYLKPHSHYISLFALSPRVQSSNCQWDVMVYKEALNMIPHGPYGFGADLDASVQPMLHNFGGKAPDAICSLVNEAKAKHGSETEHDVALIDWIIDSIHFLREHIPQLIFQNALFCLTPVMVPIISSIHGDQSYATIWSFTVVMGVHDSRGDDQNDELWSWIPFNLFQCLQVTGRGFPHQTILARKRHMEFS
ncbi:mhyt domain signaling, partial [Paraphaeosphaeria sporulosa]